MKDLKAFAKEVSSDKNLAKKVSKAKNAGEVVSIAADNGYSFDENDLKQVSGGAGTLGGYVGDISTGDIDAKFNLLDFDFSKVDAKITQNVNGRGITAQNTGGININKNK